MGVNWTFAKLQVSL